MFCPQGVPLGQETTRRQAETDRLTHSLLILSQYQQPPSTQAPCLASSPLSAYDRSLRHPTLPRFTPDQSSSRSVLRLRCARPLQLRRTTNLTVLDDEELTDRAVRYMAFLSGLKPTMNPSRVVLMDETAIYFEDPKRQMVDLTGARHVVLSSTGFASMRVTVMLAVSALGKKLTPLVIWKGAKQGSKMQKIGAVYVMFQERAWVDSTVLSEWVNMMFPTVLAHGKGKFLLWGSMRAHISKAIKAKCEAKEVGMCVIPGGLTSYLQAGDIGIYGSFNEKLSSFINTWKCSDQANYTSGGNPRPPTTETVASWVALAWKDFPDTVVQKSVVAVGLSDEATQWHIARHDVYGGLFRMKWLDREPHDVDHALLDQSLIGTVDEFTIEDYL